MLSTPQTPAVLFDVTVAIFTVNNLHIPNGTCTGNVEPLVAPLVRFALDHSASFAEAKVALDTVSPEIRLGFGNIFDGARIHVTESHPLATHNVYKLVGITWFRRDVRANKCSIAKRTEFATNAKL